MPFRIQTNNSCLELVWSNNDKDGIDFKELKDIYTSIDIYGDSNFFDYQILNRYSRSEVLLITNCTIDLSNIQGHMNSVSLIQCQCINDFSKESIIIDLNIEDSQIQTQQFYNYTKNLEFKQNELGSKRNTIIFTVYCVSHQNSWVESFLSEILFYQKKKMILLLQFLNGQLPECYFSLKK
ncbi:Hypothetical_protein [Hexamita inflata]|uniref:Hypothetical_protein n=1 Tax=Hexamita inflata TaxID=28002 RepID=A0AA86RSQ9_9EUKA|nr:Hypothetical protein HINF_LOCUS59530 [Hexamita inflata]